MENNDKKKKVIILDDDKFLLNMYAAKFVKNDIDVDTAETGDKLIEMLKQGAVPDLLLMDIIIPSMNGLETLEKIRTEGLAKNAKVIMLTNQSESADLEKAKSLGISGYIVKATSTPSEVVSQVIKTMNV